MQVTRIHWSGYRVPFVRPFVSATTRARARYGLLLRVETDIGLVGLGEAAPIDPLSESDVVDMANELRKVASGVMDAPLPRDVSDISARTGTTSGPLRFGLETALFDLYAQERGEAVETLVGGTPKPVSVNALIADETPDEAVRDAMAAVADGFTSLKLKIGGRSLEEDVALVGAVREAVGATIKLRADANGVWDVEEAIRVLSALDPLELEYVEQPVPASDIEGLAAVRRAVTTLIAADEAISTPEAARRVLEMGAADVLVIKAARLGLTGAVDVLGLARKAGIATVVTSSIETGVGIAASLHLATLAEGAYAQGLSTGPLLESDLLVTSMTPLDGVLACPAGTGLGVVLDEEAVRRYASGISGSVPD